MANRNDLLRWKKGKADWNKWAEVRLKEKEELEKEGIWSVNENGLGTNAATKNWISDASVDFFEIQIYYGR
jgi:hypothetical protein